MKNIKKILFSFILICTFFAFSKNVFATEEIQTSCEYSAPMLGVDYYYKLKIDVYDNGTKKLNYYNVLHKNHQIGLLKSLDDIS